VNNSLLDSVTYLPQYDNATVLAAVGINDSSIADLPFLKTNTSQLISLLPLSGKSLWIIGANIINLVTAFVPITSKQIKMSLN